MALILAGGHISTLSGAKFSVMNGRSVSAGCQLDSGHRVPRWTPSGVQRRPGYPAERPVFIGVCAGLWWIRIPGGFPKIRPCRWRSIAPRPPAYDFRQEGPVNSSGSGTKAATRAPLPRIVKNLARSAVYVRSKTVRRTPSSPPLTAATRQPARSLSASTGCG